ncbi:MAG: HAMP domain-containing protein [Tindallia sp. MSAO_Bac2]|nr:MAG: HAMP domain-containing protein [Tindallia sp. MSAO_Bac2]
MKWFRFDIENKILIPFVLLLILSIVTLGGVSYWTGYQMLLRNETEHLQKHLKSYSAYLNDLNRQVEAGALDMESAKGQAIAYYHQTDAENGFIMTEENNLLVSLFVSEEPWIEAFQETEKIDSGGSVQIGSNVLVYRQYQPWGWTIGYGMNRQMFSQEVLDSQKYMILLAIVSLVLSMQAAILISYHISKPIRQLVEAFGRVGQDHMSEKVSLLRKDEIGQLAKAFNEMIERLRISTTKLLDMTRFNEDILRSITTGIITTDSSGDLLSVNPAAREILEQIPGVNDREFLMLKDIRQQIQKTLESGDSQNMIHTLQQQESPEKRYLDVMTSQLKNEAEQVTGVICSFRDITERKRIENNMELLDRLSSIGQLAAGMAHEIRNPLAGMKTSLQVLQRRLIQEESETSQRLFSNTLYEIDRIDSLITELLNFARPRKPEYEPVEIPTVLQRSLDLHRKTFEEKMIEVELKLKEPGLMILVDQRQLEQIFLNLMLNAVNAMEEYGKLIISGYQQPASPFTGPLVVIEFEDNGSGISEEEMEKIFNPFYTTDPQGTGLGLSVVHELVKENNGQIDVFSKVREGSRFRVSFPQIKAGEREKYEDQSINY